MLNRRQNAAESLKKKQACNALRRAPADRTRQTRRATETRIAEEREKVVVGRRTLTSLKWSWKSKNPFLVLVLKTLKPFPALDLSIRKPDRCKGRGTGPTQVG